MGCLSAGNEYFIDTRLQRFFIRFNSDVVLLVLMGNIIILASRLVILKHQEDAKTTDIKLDTNVSIHPVLETDEGIIEHMPLIGCIISLLIGNIRQICESIVTIN